MDDLKYTFYVRSRGKKKALVLSYKDPGTGRWKQISKSGFTRVSDAKAESVKRELLDRVKITPRPSAMSDITFGEFSGVWLEDGASRWSANTYRTYSHWMHIFDPLEPLRLTDVRYGDLVRCLSAAQKEGRAVSTLNACIFLARSLFSSAIQNYGLCTENPAAGLKHYRRGGADEEKKLRTISEEEAAAMLADMKKKNRKYYILCMIGLYSGLRYGEITGLTWDAVDLDSAVLHVFQQWGVIGLDHGRPLYGLKRLKTKNSRRDVPIPPVLVRALREYRAASGVLSIDRRIFPQAPNAGTTNKYISKYCPGRSCHSMRHTYATRLLYNGVDVQTVAALIGDTVETVIKTYIHFVDEMRRTAADSVSRIFG